MNIMHYAHFSSSGVNDTVLAPGMSTVTEQGHVECADDFALACSSICAYEVCIN